MPTTLIGGRPIDVNDEGFLVAYDQWDEKLGGELARLIGLELTDRHWAVLRFLRMDYPARGETATLRRASTVGGFPIKELFELHGHLGGRPDHLRLAELPTTTNRPRRSGRARERVPPRSPRRSRTRSPSCLPPTSTRTAG